MRGRSRRSRWLSSARELLAALANSLRRCPRRPIRAACPADRPRADCRGRRAPGAPVGLWTRLAIVPSSAISTRRYAFSRRRALDLETRRAARARRGRTRATPSGGTTRRRWRTLAVVERAAQRLFGERRIDDDERVVELVRSAAARRAPPARALSRLRPPRRRPRAPLRRPDRPRGCSSRAGCREIRSSTPCATAPPDFPAPRRR